MAMYEVPTADADILLDLHHIHNRQHHLAPPRQLVPDVRGPSSSIPAVGAAAAMEQPAYGAGIGSSFSYGQATHSDTPSSSLSRHTHSLSLGQLPYTSSGNSSHANSSSSYSHAGGHTRSFSSNDQPTITSTAAQSTSPYHSATSSGESNPTSRNQTISPLIGHPQLPLMQQQDNSQHAAHSSLGSMHYSAGLGLAGVPSPPGPYATSMPIYMQAPQHMQHQSSMQHYSHSNMHGTITPPSPSTDHASSIRQSSMSDNSLPYTPQSYTSPGSSLPSSYHPMGGSSKHSYDPSHSLPSMMPSQHHHHHSLSHSTSAYPPYPLSHSAQGYMTIYTVSPMYGSKDSQINLEVGIAPHEPHYIRGFRVLFGTHGTTTRVVGELRTGDGEERVELAASTPPIQLTNRIPANGMTCQLSLQALDESGKVADWADLGVFEYTDVSSQSKGHKRPGSPLSSLRDSPSSSMRPVFPDQSPYGSPHKRGHSRGSSMGSLVNGFGYMSHQSTHSRNSSMASNSLGDYDFQLQQSPQSQLVGLPDKLNGGGSGIVAHGAQGGSTVWYSTPDGEMVERKPIARLRAPVQPPSSTPASSNLRHPPMEPATDSTPTLYRTSQLPTTGPDGSSNVATKAQLKFDADLNNMALGWSHDEWHAKRRLVHFTRSQEGGIITSTFKPISLQEITPNTIVISCIFREDKNECYVTSVDTIYLLEALVSVRFTVEEKNRIRRNLEGYKPLTITKAKQDCEEFFKVIMSFPNPKPRNIEKDVKVFPWKILSNALKKIIAKYSACYLKPEEMVGIGKLPPQPIGWAPGRTPPGQPSTLHSPPRQHASLSSASYVPPPQAPGTSGSTSSSLNMSPSMRNDNKLFGAPSSISGGSNGHHRTSTLGSVAEDEPMSSSTNGQNPLSIHNNLSDINSDIARAFPPSTGQNQQQYELSEIDELATPHAYEPTVGGDNDSNPFRYS